MFVEQLLDAISRSIEHAPPLFVILGQVTVDQATYGILIGPKAMEVIVDASQTSPLINFSPPRADVEN
jgi:hypothetical protein